MTPSVKSKVKDLSEVAGIWTNEHVLKMIDFYDESWWESSWKVERELRLWVESWKTNW